MAYENNPVVVVRCWSCGMKFKTKEINVRCPLCARRKVKDEEKTASHD